MPLLPDFVAPLPRHIDEFKKLYRERFGILLSDEEARQQLEHLLVIVSYRKRLSRRTPKSEEHSF